MWGVHFSKLVHIGVLVLHHSDFIVQQSFAAKNTPGQGMHRYYNLKSLGTIFPARFLQVQKSVVGVYYF